MPRLLPGFALLCLLATAPAVAQETRAAVIAAERAERAASIRPYSPNTLERAFLYLDEEHILERLAAPPLGFYPRFGGLPSGSGLTAGPGYRLGRLDGPHWLDAALLWSHTNARAVELRAGSAGAVGGRLAVDGGVTWRDLTEQDFWGLGGDTPAAARTNFRRRDTTVDVRLVSRPVSWLTVTPSAGVLASRIAPGLDNDVPDTSARFDDRTAPGIGAPTRLGFAALTLDADWRDEPGNTRSGVRYLATVTRYTDRRGGLYDFTRLDADLLHVIPIFDKKRNFAVRVLASSAQPTAAGDVVPFYLMPWLGGAHTIRGLRNYRLRDRASLLITGEYRWEAFSGLDMALFLDSGDVAPRWSALDLGRMHTSAGVGFRFNTNRRVFLRIDSAWGHEGARLYIKFGPVF